MNTSSLPNNFIESYLDYREDTEPPTIFHRWAAIGGLGALLARNSYITFGDSKIFPNQYIMLVGEAGSRKTTSILMFSKFMKAVEYKKFAARKTSKEKFLLDLELGFDNIENEVDESMDVNKGKKGNQTMKELFGVTEVSMDPKDVLIAADEMAVFMGHGNVEFIDMLTDLWDFDGVYINRIKSGKSVKIPYPTVNLLGGSTNTNINMAFPKEVIGQGLFSRIILVHSDPSGRRIAFPTPPPLDHYLTLVDQLARIKRDMIGEFIIDPGAKGALKEIYDSSKDLEDIRFKAYSSRRFTHLLKLCMILSAAKEELVISIDTVVYANTILHFTEHSMPKALGEFGKARHSDVSAKILDMLEKSDKPLHPIKDIWPEMRRDLDSQRQLIELLAGLRNAGKIQQVTEGGILPFKQVPRWDYPYCTIALLREWVNQRMKEGLPT